LLVDSFYYLAGTQIVENIANEKYLGLFWMYIILPLLLLRNRFQENKRKNILLVEIGVYILYHNYSTVIFCWEIRSDEK